MCVPVVTDYIFIKISFLFLLQEILVGATQISQGCPREMSSVDVVRQPSDGVRKLVADLGRFFADGRHGNQGIYIYLCKQNVQSTTSCVCDCVQFVRGRGYWVMKSTDFLHLIKDIGALESLMMDSKVAPQ